MTTTSQSVKTLNFQTQEDKKSFVDKFVSGENFVLKSGVCTYDFLLSQIAKEDGSGKRFLFKAVMLKVTSDDGKVSAQRANFTGYFDTDTKTGWIKFVESIEW